MGEGAIAAHCHCGAIAVTLEGPPEFVAQCNCSLCTAFGLRSAYYRPGTAFITGEFDRYTRPDKPDASLVLFRCSNCGMVTHWHPLEARATDSIGVNANLLSAEALDGVRLVAVDGRSR